MWLKWQGENSNSKHRIVCCGHAGSTYVDFVNWKTKLHQDVEVVAVSLPGRCVRIGEEPISELAILVDEISRQIKKLPPLPTTIYGISFGGVLAYEAALKLRDLGYHDLKSVIISACSVNKVSVLGDIDTENKDEVLSKFIERGYLSNEHVKNPKLVELVLPYLLSDVLCKENWEMLPDSFLDIPIHTIAWEDDSLVSCEDVHKWKSKSRQTQFCKQIDMKGGHLGYLQEPTELFEVLNELIH